LADLPLAHRPVELLGPVEQALRERRRVALGELAFAPERGDPRRLDITLTPLLSAENLPVGVSVTFEDVTRHAALQAELEGNRRDLELAYEELRSTIDELETTNEELQTANEELQTTNEELQSTNEELETMNDELQSANEELETINDELRGRTGELNQVNESLEAILTSLGLGVAVLDAHERVQVWNRRAEDLWGMRADEALDNHFLSLDIGLPSERLAPALRAVLSGGSEREIAELEAVNRRGRPIVCAATVLPLVNAVSGDGKVVRGAIVMMEDRPRAE
jgi:two-component system CheB/CheR fusion protein